jgi:hypothetical protein
MHLHVCNSDLLIGVAPAMCAGHGYCVTIKEATVSNVMIFACDSGCLFHVILIVYDLTCSSECVLVFCRSIAGEVDSAVERRVFSWKKPGLNLKRHLRTSSLHDIARLNKTRTVM